MASRMDNGQFSFELTEINKIKYPNIYFKIDHNHDTNFQCLTARTNFSTRCQFHQQFMSVLFVQKCSFCQNVTRKKRFRPKNVHVKC